MKNKIIGVDLDEVLAELVDHVLEYNDYKIGNNKIEKNGIKDYYIHKMDHIDVSMEEAVSWFRDAILSDLDEFKINTVKGASEKLTELKNKGYSLVIVTARTEDLFGEYTEKWIDFNFPGIFDDIIFANHFNKKSQEKHEICLEKGIHCMIEDNYDYAIGLAKSGIKTYLLEKPWNNWQGEYHDNIVRIKSWEDFKI